MGSDSLRLIHTVASVRKSDGGPSRTVTALCEELGRLGAHVELLSRDEAIIAGDENLIPADKWVTTTLLPLNPVPLVGPWVTSDFRAFLHERCQRQRVQLIHDHGIWLPCNHATATVARKSGLPLVISPRGMLEPWALRHRAWKKRLAWSLYQRRDLGTACVLHATAQQEVENLRRLGLRQPIALIPNGVALEGLTLTPVESSPERPDAGTGPRRRTALFLSRIHPIKGLLALVDAWGLARPSGWRMVIAGPDEAGHRAVVEARIGAMGLVDDFEFVGAVDGEEKQALLQHADLFVLPSFSENFGIVVAEALTFGIPVLTTRGTPWQDLPAYECGWWVPTDAQSLAAALREATSLNDAARRAMGERGRLYVQRYAWPAIARQMLEVYQWVLGHIERPACVQID